MSLFLLLAVSAIILASVHMIAPDHWLPVTVISSIRKFSNSKRFLYGLFLGTLHAVTSIALAFAALTVGILVAKNYFSFLYEGGEILLVIIGIYFISTGFLEKSKPHSVETMSSSSALSVSILPDFALIPILITGASLGASEIGAILTVFTLSSALSLSAVVMVGSMGVSKAVRNLPPRYMDYIMGGVLILTAIIIRFV